MTCGHDTFCVVTTRDDLFDQQFLGLLQRVHATFFSVTMHQNIKCSVNTLCFVCSVRRVTLYFVTWPHCILYPDHATNVINGSVRKIYAFRSTSILIRYSSTMLQSQHQIGTQVNLFKSSQLWCDYIVCLSLDQFSKFILVISYLSLIFYIRRRVCKGYTQMWL